MLLPDLSGSIEICPPQKFPFGHMIAPHLSKYSSQCFYDTMSHLVELTSLKLVCEPQGKIQDHLRVLMAIALLYVMQYCDDLSKYT